LRAAPTTTARFPKPEVVKLDKADPVVYFGGGCLLLGFLPIPEPVG